MRGTFSSAADPYAEIAAAERAVIAHCLIRPNLIQEIAPRLKPSQMGNEWNRRVYETLGAISVEARTPSIEAVVAVLGDDEVKPNISVRKFLLDIAGEVLKASILPWQDAVEVVVDQSRRRRIAAIGGDMVQSSGLAVRISDLASDAVKQIDEVLSEVRTSRLLSYDAEKAGDAAIAHISSAGREYPTTGLDDLDRMIGGWPLGELSIVAGRPGAGKSAVASSMMLRAGAKGCPSILFSLEMTREQLGARMLTDMAYTAANPIHYEGILNRRITEGRDLDRLRAARDRLKGLPIFIEEQRGLTVSEITARSRKIAAKLHEAGTPLKAIFVDHMMLVRASDRYSGNRVREVGEISEGLTLLAQDLDVAVIALCQLNRSVEGRENKRPTLSDLRDSGEVEQNASTVAFLYRPAYYLEQMRFDENDKEQFRLEQLEKVRHTLEISIAKNRNGRVGVVEAFADMGANAIRNANFKPNLRAA
jgi:replicative DNA helicase